MWVSATASSWRSRHFHALELLLRIPHRPFTGCIGRALRGDATEHTYRATLKTLIESAAPGLLATNEPKATQRENKPDYIVRKAASVIGFVEAKDVDKSLKATLKRTSSNAILKRCLI